jgi:CheY-like chemotaxis protein
MDRLAGEPVAPSREAVSLDVDAETVAAPSCGAKVLYSWTMSGGPQKTESGTRARIGRVLVINDAPQVGDELKLSLSDQHVVCVESGEDALALVAAGRWFDLILCEVMMQGMNGIEVLASLEDAHPDQAERVVFMTDRLVSPVVTHLLEGTHNLCIERPFDAEGLRSLLERRTLPSAERAG